MKYLTAKIAFRYILLNLERKITANPILFY